VKGWGFVAKPEYWLVVSDLHCGSTVALHPPDFECDEGYKVKHNALTGWIWQQWQGLLPWAKSIAKGGNLNLLVNGDTVEGVHHRTTQVWSADPIDHTRAAIACLAPLAEASERVVVIGGTECHTGNSERNVSRHFAGEHYDVFRETVAGVPMMALHHMPATSRQWLQANGLGMELANHQLSEGRQGRPLPRVLVMSHRHVYGSFSDGDSVAIATAAWQGLTRYGYKVVRAENVNIGAVMLEFREAGALPTIHLYRRAVGGQGEPNGKRNRAGKLS
jgi:hypothetical protein